jgi:hypothetical protein
MESEVIIHPNALKGELKERASLYRALKQTRRLGKNIREEKIMCPQVEGDNVVVKAITWKGYMDIMDTARNPKYTFEGDMPVMSLLFNTPQEANTYSSLIQDLFRGNPVKCLPGETLSHLRLENYLHEDQCELGRVGTALLLQDYEKSTFVDEGDKLLENSRLLVHHSVDDVLGVPPLNADGDIFKEGDDSENMKQFVALLPEAVRERLLRQKAAKVLGKKAGETMLTSGIGISLMGKEVRQEYEDRDMPLRMQRKRHERPKIEARTDFYQRKGHDVNGRPVSGITAEQEIRGDAENTLAEKIKPIRERDAVALAKQAADLVKLEFLADLAAFGARTVQRYVESPIGAIGGRAADKWRKREKAGEREALDRRYGRGSQPPQRKAA